MSIVEFLNKLPRVGWTQQSNGVIRRTADCRCPIEYVADVKVDEWSKGATKLGLSNSDTNAIMQAADAKMAGVLRDALVDRVSV